MEKTRLEAFSDGVLAIIVTIMVLEMKAPDGTNYISDIRPLIPKIISYALSYLFVAIYWVNHHHLIHTVKKVKPSIMWANLNLLFWLSLIPFATAWMGENHFEKHTVATYALLACLCGISFAILQKSIAKHYDESTLKTIDRESKWKLVWSMILYISAIPVALYVNPLFAGFLFFVVSVMWLIPDKKIEKALEE